MDNPIEPWLRGPVGGVDPLVAPILYSFEQAYEDLAKYTEGLSVAQIWATPHGFGSLGFHLRHIAGSVQRLMTYVEGRQLSDAQMAEIKTQHDPGATREELLAGLRTSLRAAGRPSSAVWGSLPLPESAKGHLQAPARRR